MTREQKKTVRRALRQYGRRALGGYASGKKWIAAIDEAVSNLSGENDLCAELLRLRYIDGMSEDKTIARLHIGRTTYYRKDLEALSTVAIAAARRGLL